MKILTIRVTANDIRRGQNRKPAERRSQSCAIAQAIRRATKRKDVEWGYEEGTVVGKKIAALSEFKEITKAFVIAHDDGKKVEPFTFTAQLETA